MKRLIPLVFLVLPVALFAQSPRDQESTMLKTFGLNDSQIAQVFDIQSKTRTSVRQDAVQIRLLHAQMEKALLPASPNMQEVNGYITQISQTTADLMKAFVGARVQLRQIIGDDNFPAYSRFIRQWVGGGHRAFYQMHRPGVGGPMGGGRPLMGSDGPALGDGGPMTGSAFGDDDQDQ
ncbi:MAG: hypothetical protein ACLQCB_03000 [Spirochaetia bacterium]